jgi:hypothetical protein
MPYGTPKEEDFTNLQVALDHVKRLWLWTIDLGLSHTPKFHVLITHALRQMRRIDGFGCMLEDHGEKSHQEGEKHDQRRALQASLIARRQQMIQRSLLLRKKRKSAGLGLAAGNKAAKKQSRDIRRSENLDAEQMRPSGEKIQPHETSKQEFKINST